MRQTGPHAPDIVEISTQLVASGAVLLWPVFMWGGGLSPNAGQWLSRWLSAAARGGISPGEVGCRCGGGCRWGWCRGLRRVGVPWHAAHPVPDTHAVQLPGGKGMPSGHCWHRAGTWLKDSRNPVPGTPRSTERWYCTCLGDSLCRHPAHHALVSVPVSFLDWRLDLHSVPEGIGVDCLVLGG